MSKCCGKEVTTYVPKGYGFKEIKVKCGNTSPTGYPYLCHDCSINLADVNWQEEARLNGEAWGEDDY